MSVTKLSRSTGISAPSTGTWQRPTDWLTIPDIPVGTQKMYGLVAVFPENANYITLLAGGAFTVDWGDGSGPINYANGAKAERNIQWANVPANTLTSEGFRQALVTVTPQAGNTFTTFKFEQLPTGNSGMYISPWREVVFRAPNLGSLNFSTATAMNGARWITFLGPTALTSLVNAFGASRWLRGITGTQWTSLVTAMNNAFDTCVSLETVPQLDTSAVTSFQSCFQACYNLKSLPLLNTSNSASFVTMFNGCVRLTGVPQFDTSKATTISSMFTGCSLLQTVPLFNTSLVTDISGMFNACTSLISVPLFDTSKVTNFVQMFNGCSSLKSVPAFVTTAGTSFANMFTSCSSLQTIPQLDLSNGISFASMFQNCTSLEALPAFATGKGTNFQNFMAGCLALRNLDVDVTNATPTNLTGFFGGQPLRTLFARGLKFSNTSNSNLGSPASMNLSAQALNDFYTALGTATGAQTLSVAGNPGSGSSNTAIATAKGWTIVGG